MAVLGFVTVQHVPFPVEVQRRTLEPDGIALFALQTAGDASGGNVLITVRSDDNEFFYILKAIALRVNTSVANPGPVTTVWNPEWIEDLQSFAQGFNLEITTPVLEVSATQWRQPADQVAGVLRAAETVPVGKVRPLSASTQDLMLFNWPTNTNNAGYFSMGLFYVYRKEALTVPGFLDQLVRPGLTR